MKVLAVSNDPGVIESARTALRPFSGEIQGCEGVCAAGRLILREGTDLILLDLGLPGLTGESALRLLREVAPRAIVLVLAKEPVPADTEALLMAGARRVVAKPIDLQQLREIVSEETFAQCGKPEGGVVPCAI